MNESCQFLTHVLAEDQYQILIPGEATELLIRIKKHAVSFPKSSEVFGCVLQAHLGKHSLLEDWLIIPYFRFFWDENSTALKWLEDRFSEVIRLIGVTHLEVWVEEVIKQTNCLTTHALCDRLYDYQLQLYGGLYLARREWAVEFIPVSNDGKSPDIKSTHKQQGTCVLECKFVHTSEKYGSFWLRYNKMARSYAQPKPPFLLYEQFGFSSSLKIKTLSPLHCTLLKAFIRKVYDAPDIPQIGVFGENRTALFRYDPTLSTTTVPIAAQSDFAQARGEEFEKHYLQRLLSEASAQLKKPEYSEYKKVLFIGLQPDTQYSAPWNKAAFSGMESAFKSTAGDQEIEVIFSKDVGFPVVGYL